MAECFYPVRPGENDQPALERLDLYQEEMTMTKLPLNSLLS
jgi:hypothetical protein